MSLSFGLDSHPGTTFTVDGSNIDNGLFKEISMSNKSACIICGKDSYSICSEKCFIKLKNHFGIPFKKKDEKLSTNRKLSRYYYKTMDKFLFKASELLEQNTIKSSSKVNTELKTSNILEMKQKKINLDNLCEASSSVQIASYAMFDEIDESDVVIATIISFLPIKNIFCELEAYTTKIGDKTDKQLLILQNAYNRNEKYILVEKILNGEIKDWITIIVNHFFIIVYMQTNRLTKIQSEILIEAFASAFLQYQKHDNQIQGSYESILYAFMAYSGSRQKFKDVKIDVPLISNSSYHYNFLQVNSKNQQLRELSIENNLLKKNERKLKTKNQQLSNKLNKITEESNKLKEQEVKISAWNTLKDKNEELISIIDMHKNESLEKEMEIKSLQKDISQQAEEEQHIEVVLQEPTNLEKIVFFPSSAVDLLNNISVLYSEHIIVTDQAYMSASELNVDKKTLQKIWKGLESLEKVIYKEKFISKQHRDEKFFHNITGLQVAYSDGKMTKRTGRLMRLRELLYEGQQYDISPHIKIGNREGSMCRIHFCIDESKERIIIGFCGNHLETAISKKQKV
ncbi:MAG: hypothetical protein COB67_02495 [SAR324 cluster bacterium]|uniref:Uncharacterized protein n=1 Tax=SAR324 cluster bacterium TaxID=2024889 RepID=A0A2A4T9X6_9DELT|nr:MAG: hypothetical protein COB67_02495 [SAR324 cluster bacterium]